ncbi:hypothetical protein GOQ30_07435 [Flavobacterium sp. TP390]|uniref:Uncharacterized protein n=1 Tax=Flavobacterium profundi TaxID=1774945 RepID=A0A6I4ISH1_9FLAO|nr:hypothetical protein [Flavobacterium profundi]MVO08997.1 hypothetical protein [Flavobacterium profundi]
MITLEGNMNLGGLILLIIIIMVGPPIVLSILGFIIRKNNPKAAKILYILSGIYLLIGLGICGSMMA